MSIDLLVILLSVFIVIGILIYNFSKNLGVPSFVIFMGIGLLFGDGTWGEPVYDRPELTEFLSNMALNIIIFVGGFNTSSQKIRLSFKEGIVLSTLGVLLTALILGYFTHLILDIPIFTAILFGAIVSSTDAAVVFGILDSKKLNLKHNTGGILEFESATNDPMTLILVTIFCAAALDPVNGIEVWSSIATFLKLLIVGAISGLLFGFATKWILSKVIFKDFGLVPIFLLAMFFTSTHLSSLLGGNLLVTSYIFGVITGNVAFAAKDNCTYFNNSLSWLAEALMFFFLGLQIFIAQIGPAFFSAILPAIFLILVARPLAVQISYLPFRRIPFRKRLFVSFIGLKGATPIVFAFIPLLQGVPQAEYLFNMVFYVVLFSILLQGTLLGPAARYLKLIEEP